MGPDARGGTADTTGAMGMASRKHSPVTSVVGHGHIYIYVTSGQDASMSQRLRRAGILHVADSIPHAQIIRGPLACGCDTHLAWGSKHV